jgi:hypothetical protein
MPRSRELRPHLFTRRRWVTNSTARLFYHRETSGIRVHTGWKLGRPQCQPGQGTQETSLSLRGIKPGVIVNTVKKKKTCGLHKRREVFCQTRQWGAQEICSIKLQAVILSLGWIICKIRGISRWSRIIFVAALWEERWRTATKTLL